MSITSHYAGSRPCRVCEFVLFSNDPSLFQWFIQSVQSPIPLKYYSIVHNGWVKSILLVCLRHYTCSVGWLPSHNWTIWTRGNIHLFLSRFCQLFLDLILGVVAIREDRYCAMTIFLANINLSFWAPYKQVNFLYVLIPGLRSTIPAALTFQY